jgi:uncharacterized membrane protein YbhN (UPF0104 family)
MLRGQLPAIGAVARATHPRWGLVAAASLVVLATYALLIESWRRILGLLGGALSPASAAVIWLVSSLARYIPGILWQLGAMTEMTRRRGVPISVSTGAAMVITVVNLITGLGVFALATAAAPSLSTKGTWILWVGTLLLVAAPFALPRVGDLGKQITGRDIVMPRVGIRPLLLAGLATAAAWLAYGVAFWLLVQALLPGPPRSFVGCLALYTGAYLTGLLNLAPAGLGAAEGALIFLAPQLGVATAPEAAVLAAAVRIWRTLLEVVPGIIAAPFAGGVLRNPAPTSGDR